MGHSPWEFMHDLHIAEMYRPPNAVNLLLFTHALLHKELRKNYKGIRWRLTVVQGHRNWYQSKAHVDFLFVYRLSFPRYNDLLVEDLCFYRAMLCIAVTLLSQDVRPSICPSVCPSVRHRPVFCRKG